MREDSSELQLLLYGREEVNPQVTVDKSTVNVCSECEVETKSPGQSPYTSSLMNYSFSGFKVRLGKM